MVTTVSGDAEAFLSFHMPVISEPRLSSEYSRSMAYRRACACLSVAHSRYEVEVFDRSLLRAILVHAAEWPLFDLLHSLAMYFASMKRVQAS